MNPKLKLKRLYSKLEEIRLSHTAGSMAILISLVIMFVTLTPEISMAFAIVGLVIGVVSVCVSEVCEFFIERQIEKLE